MAQVVLDIDLEELAVQTPVERLEHGIHDIGSLLLPGVPCCSLVPSLVLPVAPCYFVVLVLIAAPWHSPLLPVTYAFLYLYDKRKILPLRKRYTNRFYVLRRRLLPMATAVRTVESQNIDCCTCIVRRHLFAVAAWRRKTELPQLRIPP